MQFSFLQKQSHPSTSCRALGFDVFVLLLGWRTEIRWIYGTNAGEDGTDIANCCFHMLWIITLIVDENNIKIKVTD